MFSMAGVINVPIFSSEGPGSGLDLHNMEKIVVDNAVFRLSIP